jgi:GDP-L-fucose synthase
LAEACFHVLRLPDPPDWLNVGTGQDVTILQAAQEVAQTVGFAGSITTDPSKPDGTPRKLLDVSRLRELGWSAQIPLAVGLRDAFQSFLAAEAAGTARLG